MSLSFMSIQFFPADERLKTLTVLTFKELTHLKRRHMLVINEMLSSVDVDSYRSVQLILR